MKKKKKEGRGTHDFLVPDLGVKVAFEHFAPAHRDR